MADAIQLPSTDPDVDAEADAYLRLLTDALRAGPGSPEWSAAVDRANVAGHDPQLDEYAVLLAARERLAEGRAYRAVRAGPGFGRRLMARVDEQVAARPARRSPLSTSWLALIGVGVAVGVVGIILSVLFRSGGDVPGAGDLATAYFGHPFASASMQGAQPLDWRPIGSLPLDAAHGLAVPPSATLPADYAGGGIVTRRPVPADEALSVEATFHFGHVGPGCVPQLFVADGNDFSADRGVGHELVWRVQDGQGQVAPADGAGAGPRVAVAGDVVVKMVVAPDGDAAVVCNGKVLWTGKSGLADGRPRYAGVRLSYRHGDGRRDAVTVTGLKVSQR